MTQIGHSVGRRGCWWGSSSDRLMRIGTTTLQATWFRCTRAVGTSSCKRRTASDSERSAKPPGQHSSAVKPETCHSGWRISCLISWPSSPPQTLGFGAAGRPRREPVASHRFDPAATRKPHLTALGCQRGDCWTTRLVCCGAPRQPPERQRSIGLEACRCDPGCGADKRRGRSGPAELSALLRSCLLSPSAAVSSIYGQARAPVCWYRRSQSEGSCRSRSNVRASDGRRTDSVRRGNGVRASALHDAGDVPILCGFRGFARPPYLGGLPGSCRRRRLDRFAFGGCGHIVGPQLGTRSGDGRSIDPPPSGGIGAAR